MARNWTKFDRRASPITDEAFITIQRRGTFSVNRAAREAIGEPEAIELLYDADERVIGFRPVDPALPHAYRLRKQGRSNSWIIGGQAFTKTFKIDTEAAVRYAATIEDGVLVVDLKRPGADATVHRKKSSDD